MSRGRPSRFAQCVTLLILVIIPSLALSASWHAFMVGDKVVPPVDTSSAGEAGATFAPDDTCGDSLYVFATFFLQEGVPVAWEFHLGSPEENSPSMVRTTSFVRDEYGVYQCSMRVPFDGSSTKCDSLDQGLAYGLLTTSSHPDGEIRGYFERVSPVSQSTWGSIRRNFR